MSRSSRPPTTRSRRCSRRRRIPPITSCACCRRVNGVATVELVAINAALAGVEPAAFPFVLAALEALSEPEWNAFGLTTTTSSVFPMLIVNGPCRDDLGIDYRASCMGGAAGRGSMTIGRAVALCLRNIGGQRAGETTKSVFGQPARFGFCIGEWEERSPWPSLAERRGFTAGRRRRHRARRQGHVPDGRHPQRRRARPALPDREEHGVPAREHVPRQRRQRRGRRRVQPDVGRTLRRRVPGRRRPHRVPAATRVAADRPLAGRERADAPRPGPRRRPTGACTSSSAPIRSCRSCAAASAACTRSGSRASARARCRASPWCGRHDDGPGVASRRPSTSSPDSCAPTAPTCCCATPTRRPRACTSRSCSTTSRCADCILPPDDLRDTISAALAAAHPG